MYTQDDQYTLVCTLWNIYSLMWYSCLYTIDGFFFFENINLLIRVFFHSQQSFYRAFNYQQFIVIQPV